ncbi:MAG: quinolinate synthase NadA [Phycisphaerae bacterium]|jgi:quinolinate synthase
MMLFQPPLPPMYRELSEAEMGERVRAHKRSFGERLVILGHHYQQDDVIQFADYTGDSLKLSQLAAKAMRAEYVVFCGVHFMAESADILTDERVAVILPDLSAGCSMADMAAIEQVEDAWDYFAAVTDERIIPVTYVNSAASVKAFVGRHGGACCTSSNARRVLEWALSQGDKVLFLPDQHLGRNTAYAMGFPLDSMAVYDPHEPDGGLSDDRVRGAKFLLWKGHCSVHALFTEKHCDDVRAADPACQILVHPECRWAVVQKADLAGSTEYIIKTIDEAPEGSRWAVGTEIHLVNRLAERHAGRKVVRSLAGVQCLCTTMYRIDLPHLLWSLDELAAGRIVNQVKVDPETRHWAVVALQRMLENVHAQPVGAK